MKRTNISLFDEQLNKEKNLAESLLKAIKSGNVELVSSTINQILIQYQQNKKLSKKSFIYSHR